MSPERPSLPPFENPRTLRRLAETTAALERALAGERSRLEWDVLRDAKAHCRARGVAVPALEERGT